MISSIDPLRHGPSIDSSMIARNPASASQMAAKDAEEAAIAFEAVFLQQIVSMMTKGLGGDHAFGGGHAETMWRGIMAEHIADAFAERGGLGIATHVKAEIIRLQEGMV